MYNFLPSLWRRSSVPARPEESGSFYDFRTEMNRLFDDFFKGFDLAPFESAGEGFGKFFPSVDMKENDKEVVITAELPGLEEKDFEVLMTDGSLTIKGEKKEEKEEKKENYYQMERSYGYFNRVVPLPEGIDSSKADAQFKNGILSIHMPRTAEAQSKIKKIAVKTG